MQRYLRRRLGPGRVRARRRVETPPGAQAQADWAEAPRIGRRGVSAFALRLSCSRKSAVVWSPLKDTLSWLWVHGQAFVRLKGVTGTVRVDNVKTAIARGAGVWGEVNRAYLRYAEEARFHIDPCPPRSPEAKGKVERGILDLRGWGPAPTSEWSSLEELQAWTDARLLAWESRRTSPATGRGGVGELGGGAGVFGGLHGVAGAVRPGGDAAGAEGLHGGVRRPELVGSVPPGGDPGGGAPVRAPGAGVGSRGGGGGASSTDGAPIRQVGKSSLRDSLRDCQRGRGSAESLDRRSPVGTRRAAPQAVQRAAPPGWTSGAPGLERRLQPAQPAAGGRREGPHPCPHGAHDGTAGLQAGTRLTSPLTRVIPNPRSSANSGAPDGAGCNPPDSSSATSSSAPVSPQLLVAPRQTSFRLLVAARNPSTATSLGRKNGLQLLVAPRQTPLQLRVAVQPTLLQLLVAAHRTPDRYSLQFRRRSYC